MTSILVVCTGNVCRSPTAEGFLRKDLQEALGDAAPTVASAGTAGWEGSQAMPEAMAAAAELGIDISSHRARRLVPGMAESADLVICMARDHRTAIVRGVPSVGAHTFTLKELVRLLERLAGDRPDDPLDRIAAAAALRRASPGGSRTTTTSSIPWGCPPTATERSPPRSRVAAVAWSPPCSAACLPTRPGPRPDVRIAIGSDHSGYALKEALKGTLHRDGHEVLDVGTDSETSVDYPAFCAAAARAVADGRADRAIVVGGSGQGEQIAANKVDGVRAALCHDLYLARLSRAHNDANVLSMGARVVAQTYAEEIVRVWLETPFEGGRHVPRIEQIAAIERGEL